MTEGETAESIRSFLATLSLTGIPQPLDYLIESTAARHGLVRVRTDDVTGRTLIESTDAALRDTIAVDQALRPLGLLPEPGALVSRVTTDEDVGSPLTGQSEHLANQQIGIEDSDKLSQLTFLLTYASNRVTSRGANTGGVVDPDIIESPGFNFDIVAREALEIAYLGVGVVWW